MMSGPLNQTLQDLDMAVFRKLTSLTPATMGDLAPFAKIPMQAKAVSKGDIVIDNRATRKRLYLVTSGWFYAYSFLPNGRRQVYHIYQEGDFIGFEDMMHSKNAFSAGALTAGRICEIDIPVMNSVLGSHTRFASYLYAMSSLNHIIMMDRMQSIARQNPRERVAHFLLEMANRVRVTSKFHSGQSGNSLTFNLPMVQDLFADCVGLTAVHVSRTLTWMTQEGLIARPSRTLITIKDEDGLIDLASYRNRYKRD